MKQWVYEQFESIKLIFNEFHRKINKFEFVKY